MLRELRSGFQPSLDYITPPAKHFCPKQARTRREQPEDADASIGKPQRFRVQYNLSPEALSERADFNRAYVSQLERQAINSTLDTMVTIAIALGV